MSQDIEDILTWDRGKEMTDHPRFTVDAGVYV